MLALRISVSDRLRISFASFQFSPALCETWMASNLVNMLTRRKVDAIGHRESLGRNKLIQCLGMSGRGTRGKSTPIGRVHLRQLQS